LIVASPLKAKARLPLLRVLARTLGAALLLHGSGAAAMGLMQAYEAALQNDPTYRSAFYAGEGGKENGKLGLANLLPNISGSYSGSQNRTTRSIGKQTLPEDYISRSAGVQLRQTLFNLDGWARYKQGQAQSKYAESQFASQQQEVIIRVISAYCDLLFKEDLLTLARAERDMYVEQRKVNDRLFEKGEGTKTDMLETQARLDVAEAQVLESMDNQTVSRDTLARIIGGEVGVLDPLAPDFRVRPTDGRSFDEWKAIAMERNPDIKTMVYGAEIAHQEVNKTMAGHAPRLDFIANYSKNSSDSITTVNQDTTVRSIGIQLNIPLYSGGATNAQARQAVAGQEKAKADLQAQTDKVLTELRKDYSAFISSVSRVAALEKSVASAELLMKATTQSIKGGVRINLDLLNARQQYYVAKRDLAQARYNYLLNSLRMRASAGTLGADDVRDTAMYFR
jgi:protease secretion system outer membrane protein